MRLTQGVQKAYDELRRTQQVVVQQERLRALGQMASGVAHDVNNALSPIVAYSEMLLTMLPDLPPNAQQYLKTINQAGDDIARIVARMREFYRRRASTEHLIRVNLNQIIDEVIELTRPRWRDVSQREGIQIQIQRELDPQLPLFLSESSDLREALINLIFNAVDAMPRGGTITLATHCLDRRVGPHGESLEQQIQVEVRDDGIGMDEKTRQRCLEPFFSTKVQRGGTGLGLAMVYGMMQRHEGSIEIDSELNRGTCVRLTFPLREAPLPVTSSSPPGQQPERSLNILCIDDESQVREMLNDCLGHFKHRVSLAATGKQGLELFRAAQKKKEPYQVVITDLGMPEIDGQQVARTVKAESPATTVIMLTGWGSMMKEDGKTTPEIDALVAKPPRVKELNELLLRLTTKK
jgi:nitrogen-specific signal transduction histidine kinase/ActR/RegA family two-component response regulator